MSTKWLRSGLVAAWLSVALVSVAMAQSVASNSRGTITDEAGTPIANATVVITHVPSGTRSTATTGPSGGYFKSGLRVGGPYTVDASANGYRKTQLENIYLRPGSQPPITISLEAISAEVEEIVVTAKATEIYDLSNGIGSAFSAEDIGNTPSTTRDVIRTLLRDPLAQSNGTGNLSVAGANPRFNGLSIDGSLQQDDFGLGSNTYATERSPINLDAVESASLVASDYDVTASGFTGGLINLTTKSGTNEWDGSAFYFSQTDSNIGDKYDGDNVYTAPPLDEIEQGITLGGPIIKDKLFFFASYDEFESANSADFVDDDLEDSIEPGFFEALRSLIIANTGGYDPGGRPLTASIPVTSERTLAKLDWNISDRHRASYTYQKTEETGSSVNSNSFESAWYDTPSLLEANTFQFYSDWSESWSTTLRINTKDWERGQLCRAGNGVGSVEIEDLDPADLVGTTLDGLLTGDEVTIIGGCDRFRQANEYDDERLQILAKADYFVGDHVISAGLEYEDFSLRNLFISGGARGRFVYGSYNDLITGSPLVRYESVPASISNDPAVTWGLEKWSLFVQDAVQISSDLEISYGLRYETYAQSDKPGFNQEILDTYGTRSDENLDGRDLLMPRVSFRWDLNDRTILTGGFGKFSGGEPKVWISNAFSKQSVRVSEEIVGADPTVVPASLIAAVDGVSPVPIDSIDPNFTIPSDWKASLKVERLMDLGFLGRDYTFTAQVLYTTASNGFRWVNLAQTKLPGVNNTGVAPDGRIIYADLDDLDIDNLTQLTNHSDGSSTAFSVGLSNEFDNGFDFRLAYAFQDIEVVTEGGSSRGISNWRGIRGLDRNNPGATISPYQVEHSFKLGLGYEKDFFGTGQSATRVDFFAARVSGDHFNWTFNTSSSNSLFGRAGAGESPFDNNPLYVPTGPNDPLVVFHSDFDAAEQTAFFNYVDGNKLGRGITEVNGGRAGWNTLSSFRLQQEIPGLPFLGNSLGDNNFKIVLDIDNVLNLINSDWGRFVNGPGFGDNAIITADLVSAADVAANGVDAATALTGDAPRTACQSASDCVYRFNSFNDRDVNSISRPSSVWSLRLGIRFDF